MANAAAEGIADDIHCVSVQDPAPSGWHGVFKMVRASDVTKVEDCKDDIDTLLVFAGLYSAVLTAFIIESYKSLQRDPQDTMVYLMQQSFTQSYIWKNGTLSPTSPPPTLPPFEAPLWAIRVNALWFTSLVLSLAAASLGMLVKQWLREYLSLDYASVEQRLRARQYRAPALKSWNVFKFAAALPIMLQISLGIFFLGLCIFTSAVHDTIGHTTIPVVSAWLFVFLLTIVSPLFSPRCPYKSPFLKSTMKTGRRIVIPITFAISTVIRKAVRAVFHHQDWSDAVEKYGSAAWKEENEVVTEEDRDAEVLASVDALMADDHLLLTMIRMLQEQKSVSPAAMVDFAWRVIGHRSGTERLEILTGIPFTLAAQIRSQPRCLFSRVWQSLSHVVADALVQLSSGSSAASAVESDARRRAVMVLRYDIEHALSGVGTAVIRGLLAHRDSMPHLAHESLRDLSFVDIALPSRSSSTDAIGICLNSIVSAEMPLCPLCVVAMFRLSHVDGVDFLAGQFGVHFSMHYQEDRALNVLHKLLLDDDITWDISAPQCPPAMVGDLLVFVEHHCAERKNGEAAIALARGVLFGGAECMFNYFGGFSSYYPARRLPERMQTYVFQFSDIFVQASAAERRELLEQATQMCRMYCDGTFIDPKIHPEQNFIRVCLVLLRTEQAAFTKDRLPEPSKPHSLPREPDRSSLEEPDVPAQIAWRGLWRACARCLARYGALVGPGYGDSTTAIACLQVVWSYVELDSSTPAATIVFDPTTDHPNGKMTSSLVFNHPKSLRKALEEFVTGRDIFTYRNVQRVRTHEIGASLPEEEHERSSEHHTAGKSGKVAISRVGWLDWAEEAREAGELPLYRGGRNIGTRRRR